jgi:predicted Zn-dependent protease
MNAPTPTPANKSKVYFVIGFILLAIMAVTWSLDSSFVYTSFGAAVFFFFLAYYNRTDQSTFTTQKRTSQYSSKQYSSPRKDFVSEILDSLKDQSSTGAKHRSTPSPSQQMENGKKFVMMVMLFIGSIFLVVILSVFFGDDASADAGEFNDFYEKGEQARYAGNYDSAEYYYRKALTDNPEDLEALNGLGVLSLSRQRFDIAVNQFDDALRIDPDYENARYNKALTLYYQHNYRRSLNETFDLLKRSPEYYDALQLAGDNYYDQQRYDSAKFWYDQGYESGVRNAWLCHVLGYLYDRDKETQRAIELYREALNYDSTKVDVYVRLGEMFPGNEGNFYRKKAAQLKQTSN